MRIDLDDTTFRSTEGVTMKPYGLAGDCCGIDFPVNSGEAKMDLSGTPFYFADDMVNMKYRYPFFLP